ncbi:alpha/beta fold hydrolase [Aquibium sp. ELW1220]|uniref:alpha/beta fold hydrolase n=1 Tax=Aquibium sp. ELW1220 TaxID=2976766 RepID=UPI0025B07A43|nr:alpha/beta fold hydrolase [Aquibium sp. ELW1220]MDN2580987.1 alpha/beta fold hydrolase [Aquibium sp. ELW1220]
MFDRLDELFFARGADGRPDEDVAALVDESALGHIEIVRSIQERLVRARTDDQRATAVLESVPNPSYLVRRSETVIAANAMAHARQDRMPAMLRDLLADPGILRRVREYLSSADTGRLLAVAGHADPRSRTQTSVLVKRVENGFQGAGEEPVFLLSIVDFGFDEAAVELFRSAYGLTQAEARVAVLLASGLRLPDVAAERGVSVDTVRTQIKLIKNKTSVRDIPALVRLLCGFSAGVLGPTSRRVEPVAAQAGSAPVKVRRQIVLRDGRRLQYLEQGAADGEPVLMLHNLPYGAELPEAAIRQAHRDGLRIVAPFRAGFGGSDMVAVASDDDLIDSAAGDMRDLLGQLGIVRAVVVSHSTSAPFALRFARLHPECVRRLVAVSRAPIWRDEWLKSTPQRQRFMLRMARSLPQLLPVVTWAMVSVMETAFANDFVVYNCRDSEVDVLAMRRNPEIADLIAKGSVEALRNGVDAFCRETRLAMFDFSPEARATGHKFQILHGRDDVIVHPSQSLAFAEVVPGTSVELVDGAGQLLFLSHWQQVFEAIRRRDGVAPQEAA